MISCLTIAILHKILKITKILQVIILFKEGFFNNILQWREKLLSTQRQVTVCPQRYTVDRHSEKFSFLTELCPLIWLLCCLPLNKTHFPSILLHWTKCNHHYVILHACPSWWIWCSYWKIVSIWHAGTAHICISHSFFLLM